MVKKTTETTFRGNQLPAAAKDEKATLLKNKVAFFLGGSRRLAAGVQRLAAGGGELGVGSRLPAAGSQHLAAGIQRLVVDYLTMVRV